MFAPFGKPPSRRSRIWPFFTVAGVRPGRGYQGLSRRISVLYGWARAAENIIIARKISGAQPRANVLILLDCDSPAWTANQCWTSVLSG